MIDALVDVEEGRTGGTISGRSSTFDNIERGFSAAERWLSYLGLAGLLGLMFMVVAEVVSRYIFNNPIDGYIDFMEMMMTVLVFLTLAYCHREGGHIRMEIFMTRVVKGGRPYDALEVFHSVVSLVAFGTIAYFMVGKAIEAYVINDVSLSIAFPMWPAKALIAIGAIFLCLRFIMHIIGYGMKPVTGVQKTES